MQTQEKPCLAFVQNEWGHPSGFVGAGGWNWVSCLVSDGEEVYVYVSQQRLMFKIKLDGDVIMVNTI